MIKNSRIFYAKILLFGEYSVIFNSRCLTIPYGHFRGELTFLSEDNYTDINFAKKSNQMLSEFYSFLERVNTKLGLDCIINLKTLKEDIKKGLFFESSIPQGYGLGSSGALVAAIYKNYGCSVIKGVKNLVPEKLAELKRIFALLESFFHGTSSGVDPLNCYVKLPLLIEENSDINVVGLPRKKNLGQSAIFLLNTELPRKTEPLVNCFLDRIKTEMDFKGVIEDELLPITNSCIDSFISGDVDSFFADLFKLSEFQLTHFKPMIPDSYMEMWLEGLNSHKYYFKLCGAGGGGFILGFCKDYDVVKEHFESQGINIIPVFKSFRTGE